MPKYFYVVDTAARQEMWVLAPDIAEISPEFAAASVTDPVAGAEGESGEIEAENPEDAIETLKEEFASDGVYFIQIYNSADSYRREEKSLAAWSDPNLWK